VTSVDDDVYSPSPLSGPATCSFSSYHPWYVCPVSVTSQLMRPFRLPAMTTASCPASGCWLLNVIVDKPIDRHANPVFFTATAMIGMIALAGIVIRNSVVLIDFIHLVQAEDMSLKEAIIRSVAVRTRPIQVTAGTTRLGNWDIMFAPIFSGLAWSIIFGIVTSTLFTLVVIPVVYSLLYGKNAPVSPHP
jgi:multidrug efflux pump subunit AcrB